METTNIKDKFGNELIIGSSKITLVLAEKPISGSKRRDIADINTITDGRRKVTLRRKNKHIFRKSNSWGINWALVENLPDYAPIMVHNTQTNERFYLTIEEIKAKKEYLFFKGQGFELQIFIPLEEWHDKLIPYKELPTRFNL